MFQLLAATILCALPTSDGPERGAVCKIQAGERCGSGVAISPDGLILTARHVIEGNKSRSVTASFGDREYVGQIAYAHPYHDLAIVKVSGANGLPSARIGAKNPATGDKVVSMGFPGCRNFAYSGGTVKGIVRQPLPTGMRPFRAIGQLFDLLNPFDQKPNSLPFIETDHAILSGNSGGPLFNENSEVIGIATGASQSPHDKQFSIWVDTETICQTVGLVTGRMAGGAKPTMTIFVQKSCPSCVIFKSEYSEGKSEFGQKLNQMVAVQYVSCDDRPADCKSAGVDQVPTFSIASAPEVYVGYRAGDSKHILAYAEKYSRGTQSIQMPQVRVQIGDPVEPPPTPQPPAPQKLPTPIEPEPEIDWSLAKIVLLVKKQETSGLRGAIRERIERFAEGPLRREVVERLGGKADVQVIFQRLHPERFAAVVDAAGAGDAQVEIVALVKRQFTGISSLIATPILRIADQKIKETGDSVNCTVILERTHASDFAAVESALDVDDQPAATGDEKSSKDAIEIPTDSKSLVLYLLSLLTGGFTLRHGWLWGVRNFARRRLGMAPLAAPEPPAEDKAT